MNLKCDERDCDHIEEVDEILEAHIGKRCPLCGANLLTRHDYDQWVSVFKPLYDSAVALGLAKPAPTGHPNAVGIGYHDGAYTFRMPSGKADT